MEKTQKLSLSEKSYGLIKSAIVTCELDPGQLIAQSELAEKYGVGVTPVREALRQLAQEGYVQPVPRMGYMVSLITPRDIQEIYEMRYVLESSSVRLAAVRGAYDDLKAIAESADFTYIYKDRQSYTRFLNQNLEFHRAIAAATRNQRLADQVARTLEELNRVFHLGLELRDSTVEMRDDHVNLTRALCDRDADLAEQLIQAEILRSRDRVMDALERVLENKLLPASWVSQAVRKKQPAGQDFRTSN